MESSSTHVLFTLQATVSSKLAEVENEEVTTESIHIELIEDHGVLHVTYLILLFVTTLAGNIGE